MLDAITYTFVSLVIGVAIYFYTRAYDGSKDLRWSRNYRVATGFMYIALWLSIGIAFFSWVSLL